MFQPIRTYSKRKRNVLASLNLETSANLKTLKDITEETFLETISPLLASQEQLIENLSKSSSNKLDFNFDEENEILKEHSPPSVSIKDSDDSSQNSSGSTQKRSRKRQKQNPSDGNSTPLKSSLGRVDDARNKLPFQFLFFFFIKSLNLAFYKMILIIYFLVYLQLNLL